MLLFFYSHAKTRRREANLPPGQSHKTLSSLPEGYLILLLLPLLLSPIAALAAWQNELTSPVPGSFPPPTEMKLNYRFGWAAFTAATADFNFTRPRRDLLKTEGHGATIGLVRSLWELDASYVGTTNARSLRPIAFTQQEIYSDETKHTESEFTDKEVWRRRYTTPTDPVIPKKKRFSFPYLHDLDSAFFFIRSQPLKDGAIYRFVVFPQTTAYLATITVLKREPIIVPAGEFPCIRCEIQLQEVGRDQQLIPHSKFKRGTLWVSDDRNRIPVKAQSEIFVGSVWLELETIK